MVLGYPPKPTFKICQLKYRQNCVLKGSISSMEDKTTTMKVTNKLKHQEMLEKLSKIGSVMIFTNQGVQKACFASFCLTNISSSSSAYL